MQRAVYIYIYFSHHFPAPRHLSPCHGPPTCWRVTLKCSSKSMRRWQGLWDREWSPRLTMSLVCLSSEAWSKRHSGTDGMNLSCLPTCCLYLSLSLYVTFLVCFHLKCEKQSISALYNGPLKNSVCLCLIRSSRVVSFFYIQVKIGENSNV